MEIGALLRKGYFVRWSGPLDMCRTVSTLRFEHRGRETQ